MSSIFGGGRRRNQERKGPELQIKIPVTLEDIYNGKEINVYIFWFPISILDLSYKTDHLSSL